MERSVCEACERPDFRYSAEVSFHLAPRRTPVRPHCFSEYCMSESDSPRPDLSAPGSTGPAAYGSGVSAENALPPVEPPSAGFIIQLFVIPGIIVFIIVMVWLMFNWLALKGNDPSAYIRELSKNNANRWQSAVNLANALRAERDHGPDSIKNNPELVRQLVGILEPELKQGGMQDEPVFLRYFLCKALGEFYINDGFPALDDAVETNRDPAESKVRQAALQAIALLAEQAPRPDDKAQQRRDAVLMTAAKDPDDQVRSTAAFALGVIGGEAANGRLRELLADPSADVRYNAATGLARHGDPACVEVLCEMLDPDETAPLKTKELESTRQYKRAVIINGLRASREFLKQNEAKDAAARASLEKAAITLQKSSFGKAMHGDQIGMELAQLLNDLHAKSEK
jgi:hypothetical protein